MVQLSLPHHSKVSEGKTFGKDGKKIKSRSMFIDGTENLAKTQK